MFQAVTRVRVRSARNRGAGVCHADPDSADVFHHAGYSVGVHPARGAARRGRQGPRGRPARRGGWRPCPSRCWSSNMPTELIPDPRRSRSTSCRRSRSSPTSRSRSSSDDQLHATIDPEAQQRRGADAAHGRQHAVALDQLPDQRRREARSACAIRSSRIRGQIARGADGRVGARLAAACSTR